MKIKISYTVLILELKKFAHFRDFEEVECRRSAYPKASKSSFKERFSQK